MNLSRRSFLRLGVAGAASLAFPYISRGQHGGHTSTTRFLEPFVDPLPIPPVLKPKKVGPRDVYTMTMKAAAVKCHRDMAYTNVLTYNGLFPGPTIKARMNRAVRITHFNELPTAMNGHEMGMHQPAVHLHGAHVQPGWT